MRYRRFLLTAICLNTAFIAMGCHSQPPASEENGNRIMEISMMYPMNLEHFEQLVETEYPDIDLNVEMTTTAGMERTLWLRPFQPGRSEITSWI